MGLRAELYNVESFIERSNGATEMEVENTFSHYSHIKTILNYLRKADDGLHYHDNAKKFCVDTHRKPESDSYANLAAKTR